MTDEHDDHEALADELDEGADRMQDRSEELEDDISDAREGWEAKRRDDDVVGAPPLDE